MVDCPKCKRELIESVHYGAKYVEYICTNCRDRNAFFLKFLMVNGVLADPEIDIIMRRVHYRLTNGDIVYDHEEKDIVLKNYIMPWDYKG